MNKLSAGALETARLIEPAGDWSAVGYIAEQIDRTAVRPEVERVAEPLARALETAHMLIGTPGQYVKNFERVAEAFQRDTGKLRPGKDSAIPELAATQEEYDVWLLDKVEQIDAALRAYREEQS